MGLLGSGSGEGAAAERHPVGGCSLFFALPRFEARIVLPFSFYRKSPAKRKSICARFGAGGFG